MLWQQSYWFYFNYLPEKIMLRLKCISFIVVLSIFGFSTLEASEDDIVNSTKTKKRKDLRKFQLWGITCIRIFVLGLSNLVLYL